jgi:hypothetical protein
VVFIWHGWGIAILAIPVALAVATEWGVDKVYGPGAFTAGMQLYWLIIGVIAAGLTWLIGSAMNRDANRHKLFFIPVQYWALIWLVAGVAIYAGAAA